MSADNEVTHLPLFQANDLSAQRELLSWCMRRFVCSVAFDPNNQLLAAVDGIPKFDPGLARQLASGLFPKDNNLESYVCFKLF